MKLSKILWPEIFKNTRGPDILRHIFTDTAKKIEIHPEGVQLQLDTPFMQFLHEDINSCGGVVLGLRHMREKAPSYHVCEDFCRALMSIPDREIPLQYLPEKFLGYISFPSDLVSDTTETITGAYVYLGIADNHTTLTPELWGQRVLWVGYFGEIDPQYPAGSGQPARVGRLLPGIGRLVFRMEEQITVHDLMKQFASRDYLTTYEGIKEMPVSSEEEVFREGLTKLIINLILYLNSQDPELLKLSPAHGRSKTQANRHATERQRGHVNLCTIPVLAINWDYRSRDRSQLVQGETFVESFPRWQRSLRARAPRDSG